MVTFHRSHGNLSLETLSKWTSEQNRPLWRRVYLSANPTPALPNVGLLSASTKTRLVGGLEGLHRIAADCTDEAGRFSWCPRGDSNPHGVTRYHLKVVRLPIPPPGLADRPWSPHCYIHAADFQKARSTSLIQ